MTRRDRSCKFARIGRWPFVKIWQPGIGLQPTAGPDRWVHSSTEVQYGECAMPVLEEVRTVIADGRVVIPWVIQRALGLEHGGPVRFRVENGVVTVSAVDARRSDAARSTGGQEG